MARAPRDGAGMLTIDGSEGEGGGQILRTSLSLSVVTGRPFRIERIRQGRAKPGLLRQHLTAVMAAAEVGRADVDGAVLHARELVFRPGRVRPGAYRFAIGTAGSACLVLQTVLPMLLLAAGPSTVVLEGGTHNPGAPPFDFLARAFLPRLAAMGARVHAALDRPGFYPAGGGRMTIAIEPTAALQPASVLDRGPIRRQRARALVANLPESIARRELGQVREQLGWSETDLEVTVLDGVSRGPGNVLMLEIESAHVTEVFTGFGEPRIRAETVAQRAIDEVHDYLARDVPVGPYLADQLMVPVGLAGGGAFRTVPLTAHTTTNMTVVRRFLDVAFDVTPSGDDGTVTVEVRSR
jgi:RNA 3'-terminal phosphate cyclase (ATP)